MLVLASVPSKSDVSFYTQESIEFEFTYQIELVVHLLLLGAVGILFHGHDLQKYLIIRYVM